MKNPKSMKKTTVSPRIVLPGLLALLLLFSGTPAATAAGDGDDHDVHKRVIKIHRQCAAGDAECAEREAKRHVIIHRGDGEAGRPLFWVGEGRHGFAFGGRGGFLGVELTELTPELRGHFGAPQESGVMAGKVMADSAAARAGLAVGDIITEVDGEAVGSAHALARAIRRHESGETVTLGVWRGGQYQTLSATLDKRDLPRRMAVAFDCEEGEEDCGPGFAFIHGDGFDCGGAEQCEVRVECGGGGDCECTVNGEAADCQALHAGHGQ